MENCSFLIPSASLSYSCTIKVSNYNSVFRCDPLSCARAMATDGDELAHYYDMLEECLLKTMELFNIPERIYNCDETGLPLNPKYKNNR